MPHSRVPRFASPRSSMPRLRTRLVPTASHVGILFLLALLPLNPARADEGGMTVSASAEIRVKPNRFEIELRNHGAAELTSDAIVKFRDHAKRTVSAFEKHKLANVKLEPLGFGVQHEGTGSELATAMMFGRMPTAPAAPKTEVTRGLRVVAAGIDKQSEDEVMLLVGKLLDTAKDAGAKVVAAPGASAAAPSMMRLMYGMPEPTASGPLVTFVVENPEAIHERAYQMAIDQARTRAERMARLSGVELGPVADVRELADNEKAAPGGDAAAKEPRLTSSTFQAIPVRVSLQVRFSIRQPRGKN